MRVNFFGGRKMGKSFKDSLKALEADIHLANTLALGYPREHDGACFQMRLSYSPAAPFLLFLTQWFDCHLAGALGLLRVLIYMTILMVAGLLFVQAYTDGKTSMAVQERKASIREFYGVIFPSILQLQEGITDFEDKKQREMCALRYSSKGKLSEIDLEREAECGICLEVNNKVVLPDCQHALCLKCYHDWRSRSQSCPFCRSSLKRVNSDDLWMCMEKNETVDLCIILRENLQRLYVYIEKLPLILPEPIFTPYRSYIR